MKMITECLQIINTPTISIVIPVKNGEATIIKCIKAICNQTLFSESEIIVIDSGSNDRTLELLNNYPIRLYKIKPEEFNHGETRNYGASLAKGKFIVMTVQDAIPCDEKWLEKMIKHFEDPAVGGVCGQQIVPHKAEYNPHQWFRPQDAPNVKTFWFPNKDEFNKLPYSKQKKICGWDNVNAIYSKKVLQQIPFQKIQFGEDFLWAFDAFQKGIKLVYDTNSMVEHYHHSTPKYVYNRTKVELFFEYKHFKSVTKQSFNIWKFILIFIRNFKYGVHIKWILYNWMILINRHKGWIAFNKAIKTKNLSHIISEIPIGIANSDKKNA